MHAVKTNTRPKQNIFQWIGDHWFTVFLIVYGLWVFVPFLAPVFMNIGWTGAGRVVYFIYSFFCHQLPERSFFWFGEKAMYSLGEIQAVWENTSNPMILRGYLNTIVYVVGGTALNLVLTSLAAYVRSRKRVLFRNALIVLIVCFLIIFNNDQTF